MRKTILSTERVRTQLEFDKLELKRKMMSEMTRIEHHFDVDELKSGGWLIDVWVDQEKVDSVDHFLEMLLTPTDIEKVFNDFNQQALELEFDALESNLYGPQGIEAANQVANFFKLK